MTRRRPSTLPGAVSRTPSPFLRPRPATHVPLRTKAISGSASGLRLLVRMPTRSRPEQAISVLTLYRDLAGCPVALEVVVDDDDQSMHAPAVRERLAALGCIVTVGPHRSKIEAVNGGAVGAWDVLLLASDDMVPCKEGYGARVLDTMSLHYPHLDGALYFDDAYAGRNLCTLPILGRRLYDQFGYVYFPGYRSFFCDNEQTELLSSMGRLAYVDETIIVHRHPSQQDPSKRARLDSLYERNAPGWSHDEALYHARRQIKQPHAQFFFDAPPLWLSLLIATVPSRKRMLQALLDLLFRQAESFPREVEIVTDSREGVSIGQKRNDLLARSRGHFVAHVDDDDGVSPCYVERILAAIKKNPDADCLSLSGVMTTDGRHPTRFHHSIRYLMWRRSLSGMWERTPEHRNPVKRELAIKAGFPDISFGEDQEFSCRLRPLLRVETDTGSDPLYFYRFRSHKPSGWYGGAK